MVQVPVLHRARTRFPVSSVHAHKQHTSAHSKSGPTHQGHGRRVIWLLSGLILFLFLTLPRWATVRPKPIDETVLGIDYVGLVARPSCINQFVLKHLLQHQQPGRILLIVPDTEACQEYLGSISPKVKCIQEDSIFPDITKASVASALEYYYPQLQGDEYLKGRTLSGWYLQQLLKLAVVQALPDLSDLYVIWDMDMIPTRHIPLLYLPSPHISTIGGSNSLQLPVEASVMSSHGEPVRTVVNVGGAWSAGYGKSYERLFNKKPVFAEDGTSFVTHWIVVQKPLMKQLLAVLCPNPSTSATGTCLWHQQILKNLPEGEISHGFSEYHSYVSFVKQNWPQTQFEMSKRTWMRQPLGGDLGVQFARMGTRGGLCCPTLWQHKLQGMLGYEYYGLEAGHHPACRWNEPDFKRFYGPH